MYEGSSPRNPKPVRIGIAGIHIEASTFSPHRTTLEDFTVTRGDALLRRYQWTQSPRAWGRNVQWVPLLHAVALPGGPVEAQAYSMLRSEIVGRLGDTGFLDGVLLDIHGAMSVEGMIDVEADLVSAVRQAAGSEALISASMDLHGNVSRELVATVDLITCFRMAPHEDAWETRERAAANLVNRLRGGGRPAKAWVTIPVLLPGEKTSTRLEPAKGLYGRIPAITRRPGVLDAAIWVGYAWADEPRCKAVVVVSGDDREVIVQEAHALAQAYWDARDEFQFVAPTGDIESCIAAAVASPQRPFFVSDSGDNPTAGGAGDVSYTLRHLLDTEAITSGGVTAIFASMYDPKATAEAITAGVGGTVTLSVGGRIDTTAPPAVLDGVVHSIRRRDPVGGDIAVVKVGGLHVILTSRRKPYHRVGDFTDLGLDPRSADVVVVKIGYLEPELYTTAADWLLALTPGGVDQDLPRLGHHRIDRPMWPFDQAPYEPDLAPRLV
jgi:microcystin degradation protein MlrC